MTKKPWEQMTKKTSRPMMNERTEVSKVVVMHRGWQALMILWKMLQARRVGQTQRAMWQLMQSPLKMGQRMH